MTIRRRQHDLGPPDELARSVAVGGQGLGARLGQRGSGKGRCHRVSCPEHDTLALMLGILRQVGNISASLPRSSRPRFVPILSAAPTIGSRPFPSLGPRCKNGHSVFRYAECVSGIDRDHSLGAASFNRSAPSPARRSASTMLSTPSDAVRWTSWTKAGSAARGSVTAAGADALGSPA